MSTKSELISKRLEVELPGGNLICFRPFSEGDVEMIKDVYFNPSL